ncbi:zinc metalloproteinase nas-13 [Nilaparvata lugens]|uniref:zinc metalloproteinase nas-13 n=1 Tax=Nilaparvata lugens TaxID=108931 RepID=UPI00193C9690|nr:zinc metalloproteinase nas-13 [Nilaparvata lugens]
MFPIFFSILFIYLICPSLQKPPPTPQHSGFMSPSVADIVGEGINSWKPSSRQNIWELSGQFEGDIMLEANEIDAKNIIITEEKRWLNATMAYHIHEDFDEKEIAIIKKAITEIEKSSCLKFTEYVEEDEDYVMVQNDRPGCWSFAGRQGGGQVLNLSKKCVQHGVVVHEFLHALGFYHQQSASDRDQFIKIHWENIKEDHKHNFKKYTESKVTDLGVSYDYSSIMHYGPYAFSKNEKRTITTVEKDVKIGQRKGLSKKDKKKLNKMYNCKYSEDEVESSDTDSDEDYSDYIDDDLIEDLI